MKSYEGLITHVVDGDTIDVSIDLGFDISHTIRVRLAGINTPELRDKDLEKAKLAQKAKEFVSDFVFKPVTINIHSKDCYGRYVASIINVNTDISKALLKEGLAESVSY